MYFITHNNDKVNNSARSNHYNPFKIVNIEDNIDEKYEVLKPSVLR